MRRKAHIICRRQASCAKRTSFDISTTISSLAEGDFISSAAEASDFISGAASFAVGAAEGKHHARSAHHLKSRRDFHHNLPKAALSLGELHLTKRVLPLNI